LGGEKIGKTRKAEREKCSVGGIGLKEIQGENSTTNSWDHIHRERIMRVEEWRSCEGHGLGSTVGGRTLC